MQRASYLFTVQTNGLNLDPMAFGIIVLGTLLLSYSARESKPFINIATILKIVLLLFVSIMGYVKAQGGYFAEGFVLPGKGADGIFQAGAIMLFPYLPVDVASIAAEEVSERNVYSLYKITHQGVVDCINSVSNI